MYFDMSAGEGGGGGDDDGGDDGGGGGGGSDPAAAGGSEESYYESTTLPADVVGEIEVTADYGIYGANPEESTKAPIKIKVIDPTTISGNKYLQSLILPSDLNNPLIGGVAEGSVPAEGLTVSASIIGSPGAKFYLNIVDIDDDEVFDLSNVTIPASGKYSVSIPFPKSITLNKYKINLRAGDGTIINYDLPTTDPMWTIHQYANPTITFTKTDGTGSGVAYSGSDATLTTKPYAEMHGRTNPFQKSKLTVYTTSSGLPTYSSIKLFGEFDYAVTAAKGGALVYIKTTNFDFINSTVISKRVVEDVINSNIIRLADVLNLSVGMQSTLPSYTKTKKYSISSTVLRLSETVDLEVGMVLFGKNIDTDTHITAINSITEIEISKAISTSDTEPITFTYPDNNNLTIKSIDTDLNRITLESSTTIKLKGSGYTTLSFSNEEMTFSNTITTSGSGSASTTLTNAIKMNKFGSKDVTFTLPTDDIFTLTPNAYNQYIEVTKDTAKDINVLLLDTDDNSGSKTPSFVKYPSKGIISGTFGSGDGTITYTPNTGITGKDSFMFKVNDDITDSDTKTIFITITK
jgi:hypothetical protein